MNQTNKNKKAHDMARRLATRLGISMPDLMGSIYACQSEEQKEKHSNVYVDPPNGIARLAKAIHSTNKANAELTNGVEYASDSDTSNRGICVLSLFDGASSGLVALKQLGVAVDVYMAIELDRNCIIVSRSNHPDVTHPMSNQADEDDDEIGMDILELDLKMLHDLSGDRAIDLLIGGPPCQYLSGQSHLQGKESRSSKRAKYSEPAERIPHIRDLVDTHKERLKKGRAHMIIENVSSMSEADKQWFSEHVVGGLQGIKFDGIYLSPASRPRQFWTTLTLKPLNDDVLRFTPDLQDILVGGGYADTLVKAKCITCGSGKTIRANITDASVVDTRDNKTIVKQENRPESAYRNLTVHEAQSCMGLPHDYTAALGGITSERETQWKIIGNGFCIPVVMHLLEDFCKRFKTRKYPGYPYSHNGWYPGRDISDPEDMDDRTEEDHFLEWQIQQLQECRESGLVDERESAELEANLIQKNAQAKRTKQLNDFLTFVRGDAAEAPKAGSAGSAGSAAAAA